MRAFFASVLLVLQVLPASALNTSAEDSLVKNTHLSCKLSRDIRRRDVAQSKSAFEFYMDNKEALLAVDDSYLVEGLSAAKVKSFCARIEGDFQRQDALLIYDKAIAACQASDASLEQGHIKQAKQHYNEFKSFLAEAANTSSEAVSLGRGSLQWRKCQNLQKNLNEFVSGKVKKVRDSLNTAYSRCLPLWSEITTAGITSLTMDQLFEQLTKMKAESSVLRSSIKKLNTESLDSTLQEFQTCINQIQQALPQQFTQKRVSALTEYLQLCESSGEGFDMQAAKLLANQENDFELSPQQLSSIAAEEQALNNCLQETERPTDPIKDHWQLLREEDIQLGR